MKAHGVFFLSEIPFGVKMSDENIPHSASGGMPQTSADTRFREFFFMRQIGPFQGKADLLCEYRSEDRARQKQEEASQRIPYSDPQQGIRDILPVDPVAVYENK